MRMLRLIGVAAAIAALKGAPPADNDKLWEHRNLGKAFYENPTTHQEAVEEFRKALEIAPQSVRERINYGLALLRADETARGIAELERSQKQDPAIPHTWFNLGIAYKRQSEAEKSLAQLQEFIRLAPDEPIGHYNLGAVLKMLGRNAEALPQFEIASKLNPDLAGPHFQLFNLYRQAGNAAGSAREQQLFQEARKRNEGAAVGEDMEWCYYAEIYDPPEPHMTGAPAPRYNDRAVGKGWDPASTRMLVMDTTGRRGADLLLWSNDRIVLLKDGVTAAANTGLEGLRGIVDVAAGDFDNDGLPDLCIVTADGASLYRNTAGRFLHPQPLPNTAGARRALWLDYDHDYDVDLLLFGPKSTVVRNNGNSTFTEQPTAIPFVKGEPLDAVLFALRDDTAARDIIATYRDRAGVLYRDRLNGNFEAVDLPAVAAGAAALDTQDFDRDGQLDLVAYLPARQAWRNDAGKLAAHDSKAASEARVRADFNRDGREDYARISPDGIVHVFLQTAGSDHWTAVRLEGIKNLKSAAGATVEVKSGPYYGKQIYAGVPLSFPIDGRTEADAVRITWPNGLIQNETRQKAGALLQIKEAPRLSGSCPMIFTWNGREWQFITDVLGVAPLGASSGDGHYFPVDHDEYVQIPGSALAARNGSYEIHITEELREVSYLDQVRLIAVDHPSDVEIYTNDKFKSPPYPEFRLFGSRTKVHPIRAVDDQGRDVAARLDSRDHSYSDAFPRDFAGVARMHSLELDFGSAAATNRAALVLNGWVDWADGSTFLGASQALPAGLVFPRLEVMDDSGKWRTAVEDMGIPSGKPKTIAVDLAGKFPARNRRLRIVTNLCVYWDEIFLIEDTGAPPTRMTPIDAADAHLHFRGFSEPVLHPARLQPEEFRYDRVRAASMWNPTPGLYTRYGDVTELVAGVDDRMVVMGSGDELTLRFPANLPRVADGWSRDFLLMVDGWAKDGDANTAFAESVLPLPFHAMSAYPYPRAEHFPSDNAHQRYTHEYLTRPALRLIRPLAPERVGP